MKSEVFKTGENLCFGTLGNDTVFPEYFGVPLPPLLHTHISRMPPTLYTSDKQILSLPTSIRPRLWSFVKRYAQSDESADRK